MEEHAYNARFAIHVTARGPGPEQSIALRDRLKTALKAAMQCKDTMKSTTIRSVLSEMNAADKAASGGNFEAARRPDLAEKELQEAALINTFLPPLMSQATVDATLRSYSQIPPSTPRTMGK
ncbi:uncharacterized protein BXZ73DRAFT_107600 [Epithele typhae]|uniref:uncharacterized protein n=1 Tax=Epithele typhae TaxID=378194 RepID=UPI00200848E9|nr:uncharacterized protein BXZ73DRAFT_107600 [Epithele typhae]KAH9912158.1 hypothetical protein BXZ73DRAFT_107600 [Epithele typhae]